MSVDRAETLLTDRTLSPEVDAIIRRTDQGFRVASHTGSIDFAEGPDDQPVELASHGHHPLRNRSLNQRLHSRDEIEHTGQHLGDHATPHAMESIIQFFDSAHAPDLVVLHSPNHRFHGNAGDHGSLGASQARAPFLAAGPGIHAQGMVDDHLRSVDVAPTLAALLDLPTFDGMDGRGRPRAGTRLTMQDGDEKTALIDADTRPEHVVVLLWDGVNANALYEAAASGLAPNVAALIERGTAYRYGCLASLPTATLANHTTQGTGVFPGRSGILHNTWYDTDADVIVDLLDYPQMINSSQHLAPGVETLHEAIKRHDPHAVTVTTYEYADRGADYSTYQVMAAGQRLPGLTDHERRRHRTDDFLHVTPYRQASVWDAHSTAQACRIWRGELGSLPRYSWFTLNLTDAAGHEAGPHSDMVTAAIIDSDRRTGEILATIEQSGRLEQTAVVVLADHGMQYHGEGPTADLSSRLTSEGINHRLVDAQYLYLSSPDRRGGR